MAISIYVGIDQTINQIYYYATADTAQTVTSAKATIEVTNYEAPTSAQVVAVPESTYCIDMIDKGIWLQGDIAYFGEENYPPRIISGYTKFRVRIDIVGVNNSTSVETPRYGTSVWCDLDENHALAFLVEDGVLKPIK